MKYLENIFDWTIAKIQTHKFVVTGPGSDTLIHQVVMSETAYTFYAHMARGRGHYDVTTCWCLFVCAALTTQCSPLGVIMNCVGAGG